jgi:hypothetical protein
MKKLIVATVATVALTASGVMAAEQSKDHGNVEMKAPAATKSETTGTGATSKMKAGGPPPKDSSNTVKLDNGPKPGEAADRSGSTAVHK